MIPMFSDHPPAARIANTRRRPALVQPDGLAHVVVVLDRRDLVVVPFHRPDRDDGDSDGPGTARTSGAITTMTSFLDGLRRSRRALASGSPGDHTPSQVVPGGPSRSHATAIDVPDGIGIPGRRSTTSSRLKPVAAQCGAMSSIGSAVESSRSSSPR